MNSKKGDNKKGRSGDDEVESDKEDNKRKNVMKLMSITKKR